MKKSYLEIILRVAAENRADAGAVYTKYRQPFLDTVPGAESKELLIRDDDVQVLHGFSSEKAAKDYLTTRLFAVDIVKELRPLLLGDPDIRIYERQ